MSHNAVEDREAVDKHGNFQEEEPFRADTPSVVTPEGDEDDERYADDEQALLRAGTSERRSYGENGRISSVKGRTDVSNWEYMRGIIYETMPTLLLSLLGTFLTGELLELLATWKAFKTIDELLIIIPMLLNLKGNLEMNLSARLSTAANMGDLDSRMVRRYLIFGNLTLLQVQALLVSCLAAAFSFLVSLLLPSSPPSEQTTVTTAMYTVLSLATRTRSAHHPSHHRPSTPSQSGPREFLVVFLTAQTAASLSSAILGSFMCSLILLCRYWNLNPDNIAPAVASALGDLLTLTLLGLSSHFLYPLPVIGLLAIQAFYVLLFIASFYLTLRNQRIKGLLREGWGPLLIAMVISSGTGMFLDRFVGKYRDYGLVSIAQDGIPGGVGSVYVSRFSTSLHEAVGDSQHQRGDGHDHRATPSPHHSTFPSSPNDSRGWRGSLFAPKDGATKQAIKDARPRVSGLTLYIVTIPVQVLFLVAAYASKWLELPALWAVGFLVFFGATVVASLTLSHFLTLLLWNHNFDPDTYALPLQSATVDLIGQTFLVTCYETVKLFTGGKVLQGKGRR